MFGLFECVAEAVKNKGFKGLCDLIPGGAYLIDIASDIYQKYRERKKASELRDELARIARMSAIEAKRIAAQVAKEVAKEAKSDDQFALELYLSQIPDAVRASMKRANDPSGKSVPPDFALDSPQDLAKILPQRAPRFRPGAELPGRPGWKLEELLGAGGFGEVWLTRHSLIPHPRAVKFCTDPLLRNKLTSHEGKLIARVMGVLGQGNHPNVVPLLDAHLEGETPWLMYEYVGGGCLTDLIHRWQSLAAPEREALSLAALLQLAAAVGAFHRLTPPIVHRDLKPANVLVSPGPSVDLKITDFGIGGVAVEYLRQQNPTGLSMMSMMTGWLETSMRGSYTPVYASPQQRSGSAPDPRDDVHALGVIGFHMMTGRLTESPGIDANEDLQDAGASIGFIGLITKCVATKPERRPTDAGELAEKIAELKAPLSEPERQRRPTVAGAPAPKTIAPGSPKPAPTHLEAGSPSVSTTATPIALSTAKWLVPLRGIWFTRPADNPDAGWVPHNVKLPGEIMAKPGEVYRLALNPDATTDEELAKLRSLSGLPGLEAVDLSGCRQVTDAGLLHLAQLRSLKAILLDDTQVSDSGLTLLLTRFPELEAVGLSGAERLTQTVIPYLVRLRKLKMLALPPRVNSVDVRVEFAKRRPACKLV
jgi:eukaryotic-like serine/threonine-protein kinase